MTTTPDDGRDDDRSADGSPVDDAHEDGTTAPHDEADRPRRWAGAFPRSARTPVVVAVVLGVLLVSSYLAVTSSAGPRAVPIAVAGEESQVEQFTKSVEEGAGTGDAFDVRVADTREEALELLRDRRVYGAYVLAEGKFEIVAAGANGRVVNGLVTTSIRPSGSLPTITDAVPLAADDVDGLAVPLVVLGVSLVAVLYALMVVLLAPARRDDADGAAGTDARSEVDDRAATGRALLVPLAAVAVGSGVLVALLMTVMYDVLPGGPLTPAVLLALLAFATGGTTLLLGRLLGVVGAAVAFFVLLGLGVATAGSPLVPELMTPTMAWLSVVLPQGVAVDGLISTGYFGGVDSDAAVVTLLLWSIVVAVALRAVARRPERFPVGRPGGSA